MKRRPAPRQLLRLLPLGTLALCLISFPALAQEERERDREEREPRRQRDREPERERERGDREERRERAEPEQRRDRERGEREEPREREPRRDAAKLPAGLIGFSGQIGGIVEGKADGPALIVHVHKVHQVWDNNRADNPKALEGQRIRVGPAGHKDDAGNWRKNALHLAFIKAFPVKEDCRLEIQHREGNHFQILELSEPQRKFARSKSGEPREGARARERDREPERERAEREEPRRENSTEARIRRLEREIDRLKAELRESRGRREREGERGRERERDRDR